MPRGAYLLSGHDGPYAVERFSCAPGPAGWRYVGQRESSADGAAFGTVDVTLDGAGRAVRVLVRSGGWELRGGVVGGRECLWRRGDVERSGPGVGFTGTSPAWLVASARLLAPAPGPVRLPLLRLGDEALSVLAVEQAWQRIGAVPADGDEVDRYEVIDLATGEGGLVHLAGDVVLDAPGVRLLELEGRPTLTRQWQAGEPP